MRKTLIEMARDTQSYEELEAAALAEYPITSPVDALVWMVLVVDAVTEIRDRTARLVEVGVLTQEDADARLEGAIRCFMRIDFAQRERAAPYFYAELRQGGASA